MCLDGIFVDRRRNDLFAKIDPSVVFANATTLLKVTVDWRELRPFITIADRHATDAADADGIRSRTEAPRTVFDVDDILLERMPVPTAPGPVGKMIGPGGEESAALLLSEYALALKVYAGDVLSGDFQIFDKLRTIVNQRERNIRKKRHGPS